VAYASRITFGTSSKVPKSRRLAVH